MVGLQTLDLAIGVRVPASQFKSVKQERAARGLPFPVLYHRLRLFLLHGGKPEDCVTWNLASSAGARRTPEVLFAALRKAVGGSYLPPLSLPPQPVANLTGW